MIYEYPNTSHTPFSTQQAWGVNCEVALTSEELRNVVAQGRKSDMKVARDAIISTGEFVVSGLAVSAPVVFSAIVGTILHKENPMVVMTPLVPLLFAILPHTAPDGVRTSVRNTAQRVESLFNASTRST